MKAMILAAGRGERLRPLTDHTPKPLLKAGHQSLIEHTIEKLVKGGFKDIVINYAHLGEQFPARLGSGQRYGASLQYSAEIEGGLETAGGIIQALPFFAEEPFLVVNGDIWTDYDFSQLQAQAMQAEQLCHLVLVANPAHNLQGDFAISEQGLLQQFGATKYTFSGIGVYHPLLFAGLKVDKYPLKPLLLKAIEQQQATAEIYTGQWSDIGTVERLQALNDQLMMTH